MYYGNKRVDLNTVSDEIYMILVRKMKCRSDLGKGKVMELMGS